VHLVHHNQFILLLVEHRASVKNFQTSRSPAIPLISFHDLPVFLISLAFIICVRIYRHARFSECQNETLLYSNEGMRIFVHSLYCEL